MEKPDQMRIGIAHEGLGTIHNNGKKSSVSIITAIIFIQASTCNCY